MAQGWLTRRRLLLAVRNARGMRPQGSSTLLSQHVQSLYSTHTGLLPARPDRPAHLHALPVCAVGGACFAQALPQGRAPPPPAHRLSQSALLA